jgi:hypothetical protein
MAMQSKIILVYRLYRFKVAWVLGRRVSIIAQSSNAVMNIFHLIMSD